MNKLMIDTNIFIYAMNADSEFNADASRILNLENQLFTTSLNISEFFSVASKLRIKHNLIWKFYVSIIENVNILFPNPKSFELFQQLIRKYKPAANKVYDIEITSIMLANEIKEISTFNEKDFELVEEIKLYK